MQEIIFDVRETDDGGYTARALGHSIFTYGETRQILRANIREAVLCHFEEDELPLVVRLHFVSDELLDLQNHSSIAA